MNILSNSDAIQLSALFQLLELLILAGLGIFVGWRLRSLSIQGKITELRDSLGRLTESYSNLADPLTEAMKVANENVNRILDSQLEKIAESVKQVRGKVSYPELREDSLVFVRRVIVTDDRNRDLEFDLLKDETTGKEFFVGPDGGLVER